MEKYPPADPLTDELTWFNASQAPSRPPRKRLLIFTGVLVLLTLLGAGVFFAFSNTTNCLTDADYSSLTDEVSPETLDPKKSFYSTTFYFQDKSDQLNPDTAEENLEAMSRIGTFYVTHSQKPIVINLSVLSSLATDNLASSRLRHITSLLAQQGVPPSAITTEVVDYSLTSEDEVPDTLNIASLSITSAQACR